MRLGMGLGLGNLLSGGPITGLPNNYSFNFDGSNDYLALSDSIGFTGAFSVSMWIYPDALSNETLLGTKASGNERMILESATVIDLRFADGTVTDITHGLTFTTGAWQHFAFVRNSSNVCTVYRNGSAGGTTGTLSGTFSPDAVGIANSTNYFNGKIDEVGIWDAELSASDISKLASKPLNLSKASSYDTDRTSNLKLWLRAGDKVLPEEDASIARSDFYTDFDGSNDYIDCGNITEMNSATALTFSLWVKPDMNASVEAYPILYSKQDDGNNRILAYIDVSLGNLYLETSNATPTQWARYESFPVATYQGKWTHIAHVFDGSQSTNATKTKLYINGVQKTIDTFGATQPTSTASYSANFLIGRNSASGVNYFDGSMASVATYNTALDAQTIKQFAKSRFTPIRENNRFSVVDFDGSDDYIKVDANSSINNLFATGGTFTAWIKPNSDGETAGRIAEKGFLLYTNPTSGSTSKLNISIPFSTTAGGWVTTNYEINFGVWQHIAITYDGSSTSNEAIMYFNGISVSVYNSTSPVGTISADTADLYIGNNSATTRSFNGSMASVATYNTAKSADEVYAIYQQGITYDESSLSGLVGLWRMGDDTSKAYPTIADSSSNSNDGTITNGASDDIVQQMSAGYDMGAFESTDVSDTYPAIIDVNEPVLGAELVTSITNSTSGSNGYSTFSGASGNTVSALADSDGTGQAYTNEVGASTAKLYKVVCTLTINSGSPTLSANDIWGTYSSPDFSTGTTHPALVSGTNTYYVKFSATNKDFLWLKAGVSNISDLTISCKAVSGNPGTMTNQAAGDLVYSSVLPDQSYLTGVNSAYNFIDLDGTDAQIAFSTLTLATGNNAESIAFWVNMDDAGTSVEYVLGRDDANTGAIALRKTATSYIRFGGGSFLYGNPSGIGSGWHHVVITRSSTPLVRMYVDGTEVTIGGGANGDGTEQATGGSNLSNRAEGTTTFNRVGRSQTNYGQASITQIALWGDKQLSDSEISAIYNLGRFTNLLDSYQDNLKLYYAFGALDAITGLADTDSTIYDRSGNSLHGTISGIATGDLKSPPNADPNGYAKGDTNRSTTIP